MANSTPAELRKEARFLQTHDCVEDARFFVLARKFGKLYEDKHPEDDEQFPDWDWLRAVSMTTPVCEGTMGRKITIGCDDLWVAIVLADSGLQQFWFICTQRYSLPLPFIVGTRKEARDLFKALKFKWEEPDGSNRPPPA